MTLIDDFRSRRGRRHDYRVDEAEVDHICGLWPRVCEGADLYHRIDTVSGPTITTPQIVDITLGPPTVLIVRLLPGQLRSDFVAAGRRLAEGMGAAAVRVEQTHLGYVRVTLLQNDPLAGLVLPAGPVRSATHQLLLGRSESDDAVRLDLTSAAHVILQGASGSGKSVELYSLLAQVAGAPDLRVTGTDPTRLVLGPWANRRQATGYQPPAPALGTSDPAAHVVVLEELTAEMDRRVAALPAGCDQVFTSERQPVIVAVAEEWPGTLKVLDGADLKLGKRARAAMSRLLSEGRKAGIKVVLVAQRCDAVIIGGYERGQASHRISFRVDSADALKMLHADATPETVIDHSTALPGVGLLTAPGIPLLRFRAPHMPYAAYVATVAGTA